MDRDETEPGTADSSAPMEPEAESPGLVVPYLERLGLDRPSSEGEIRLDLFRPSSPAQAPSLEWAQFRLPTYQQGEPPGWPRSVLAELIPQPGALGDYLEHLPPGERLAKVLAAIDPADVDDFSLVEVVAAHKRMEAWSAHQAARAAAVLAERDSVNPTWPGDVPGRTRGECVVGQELSMRLRIPKQTAVTMVACGRAFTGMFEPTGELLQQGLIDYPRARAIVTRLLDLPAEVALAAQWQVLDKAPGRTLRQLSEDLDKAVIAVDPDSADDRHRTARQKRCVNHPRPLPDGMALLSARLPAADAIATYLAVDGAARAAKNNGDPRTLDQLRADSLSLMSHTALTLGHIGPGTHTQCTCGCQEAGHQAEGTDAAAPSGLAAPASADSEAPAAPLTPRERAPEPPPAPVAPREPAPQPLPAPAAPRKPAPQPLPTSEDSREPAPELLLSAPAASGSPPPAAPRPASPPAGSSPPTIPSPATANDSSAGAAQRPTDGPATAGALSEPLREGEAPPLPPDQAGTAGTASAAGSSRFADGPPLPGHRLPGCALPTVRVGMVGGGRADIGVLVPVNVLQPEPRDPHTTALDRDPEPVAELDGYGPIPPMVARALAAGGTWRRILTDPTGTQILDVGRTRHDPPANIADHVRHRDRTCIRPGCSHPSRSAELDHIHEWKDGGVTSADNLGPQCTGDHRAKTIGAFTLAYATDRTYAWTTPTGHGYLRRPDGTTTPISRHTAQRLRTLVKETTRTGRPVDPALIDAALTATSTGTDTPEHWTLPKTATPPAPQPDPGLKQTWPDEPPF